ncbi:protein kinase domain-containing protein [Methyloglobulus sp.]|uniref:serine/threonine-protein kinase n=1 Tax=Methyloglobulus sp. TaxID=2518622 RepID=UPI003989826B
MNQKPTDDGTIVIPKINELDKTILKQGDDETIQVSTTHNKADSSNDVTKLTTKGFLKEGTNIPSSPVPNAPKLKNRFILREVIGSGGMGTIFRATDLRREEAHDQSPDVAIKVLNEEFKDYPDLFIALQRETKRTQQLAHPNIVNVYDFDRDDNTDTVFMVMEILDGKPLTRYLTENAPHGLPFKEAWPIIKGLSVALAYAHKQNIIHSDFKPGNVFITESGGVKILDFGIACAIKQTDQQISDETLFNPRELGALTPAYASLEMFENQAPDPRDDIYALACVTYEILTGKHPFGKLSAQKALELNIKPPIISGLNRRQWNALNHALAFKKERRTSSVSQFIDEMEPRSLIPSFLIVVTIITLAAAAVFYFSVRSNIDKVGDKVIALTPAQELKIKDLLDLADISFEVDHITAPSGSSALWAYRQVLEHDPYNKQAKQGLEKIATLREQEAEAFFEQNNLKESLVKIEEGLEALPKHEGLLKFKKQILELETSQQ